MVRDYKIQNRIKNILNYKNDIIVVDSVESTNTALKQMAADGADEGTVLIAKSQTKGRGRLGRSFVSDDGGLYLSLLLRPKSSAEASLLITVAAAVSVAVAIENICQKNCQIKWVNDIYLNGKKVSGILTEGAINPQNGRLDYAVLGIGVNINEPDGGFNFDIKDIATSIYKADNKKDVLSELAAEIIGIFMKFYENLDKKEYLSEYKHRSMLMGKTVSFIKEDVLYTAKVLDIDDNARLILEQNGDIITLQAGEVSVRLC